MVPTIVRSCLFDCSFLNNLATIVVGVWEVGACKQIFVLLAMPVLAIIVENVDSIQKISGGKS